MLTALSITEDEIRSLLNECDRQLLSLDVIVGARYHEVAEVAAMCANALSGPFKAFNRDRVAEYLNARAARAA